MPTYLRLLALVTTSSLTLVCFVMSFVVRFRDFQRGLVTTRIPLCRAVLVSHAYVAFGLISAALTIALLDPTKAATAILLPAVGLPLVALMAAIECLNLALTEYGLRKMLASIGSFLSHLFGRDRLSR